MSPVGVVLSDGRFDLWSSGAGKIAAGRRQFHQIDYLLLVAAVAAALYTFYRLFFGYLRWRFDEMEIEEGDKVNLSSDWPPAHNGSSTGAPWRARD